MPRRILSLWLPLWRTDLWRRQHPTLDATQALVLHAHDGRRQIVLAADRRARQVGIRPGMTLAQAQVMVPDLQLEAATPEADEQALEQLASWCLWLSPIVAVDPPDGVWVDTAGCDHLHGGEAAMMASVQQRVAALGYTSRLALADTPGAAHALARHARETVSLVPADGQAAALKPLPVVALRLEPDATASLQRLGLSTIGALTAAPRGPLVKRFGAAVMRQLDRAYGHAPEPIRPLQPHEAISVQRSFVEPIGTADSIGAVIDVLVPLVCQTLAARGLGARTLDLLCDKVDGTVQAVRVRTAAPVKDAAHLARLLHERLDTIEPGFGIDAMRLVVIRSEPLGPAVAVGSLIGSTTAQAGAPLDCLIDRLRNRVGPDRVYRLAVISSQIPERAQQRQPVGASLMPVSDAGRIEDIDHLPRPTRLLDPPAAIAVIALLPEGAPQMFVWGAGRHRIRAADGPERLHGEWWHREDEYGAVRDYWIVENEAGVRFWLFRRGDGQHPWSGAQDWFLHGVF